MMKLKLLLFLFFITFLGTHNTFAQKSYKALVHEGNKSFENKQYDKAAGKYLDAINENEENFAAHYNMGNALYKSGKYEEAKAEFEKATIYSQNTDDKAAVLHNLGNAYMQTNQAEKAADYYKQALKQSPYNEATRKNYEIAKQKQKEQQQNKQEEGDKKENKDNDKKDEQKQGDEQKDQNKSEDQGKNQQNKGEGNGKEPNEDKNEGSGKLPKALEDAILNRVSNKEKETARRILNKNSYSMPESNEKDW